MKTLKTEEEDRRGMYRKMYTAVLCSSLFIISPLEFQAVNQQQQFTRDGFR